MNYCGQHRGETTSNQSTIWRHSNVEREKSLGNEAKMVIETNTLSRKFSLLFVIKTRTTFFSLYLAMEPTRTKSQRLNTSDGLSDCNIHYSSSLLVKMIKKKNCKKPNIPTNALPKGKNNFKEGQKISLFKKYIY